MPGTDNADSECIEESLSNPQVFAMLFERHAVPLHRYLVKRIGNADAEDVLGETFVTAFRSRSSYDLSRTDARPWLFGIATNLVHHYWRDRGRREKRDERAAVNAGLVDGSEEVVSRLFFEGQREPLGRALGQISSPELDVLLLVAGPGLSYEDVSIALGIPIGTVRSRLFRARKHLRELLGDSRQYLDDDNPPAALPAVTAEGAP